MQQMNPDARLAVRFYQREVENEYLTTVEGRPIKQMAEFVRIEVPGDMTSIIDTFANDEHKRRFPIQYAAYKNDSKDEGMSGTLLRDWSLLTPAQATELRHFKFYTVEQVAAASDQQIASIGMMLGMSPQAFRDKAKAYLGSAKDSALAMHQAEELLKRDQQIADLREQVERLAQMAGGDKRKPGRPARQAEAA